MIAVDTNVLVRFLVDDDPEQARRASALLTDADAVFVAKTVLLELIWVLRAAYGFDRPAIARAVRGIGGLPNVRFEQPEHIAAALCFVEAGMDAADALNLASAHGATAFYTFDQRLIRTAGDVGGVAVPARLP